MKHVELTAKNYRADMRISGYGNDGLLRRKTHARSHPDRAIDGRSVRCA